MSQINLNLSQLANGGIQEKINSELEKVLDNIMDPNTSPKEKRKLVITLTFPPYPRLTRLCRSEGNRHCRRKFGLSLRFEVH